MMISYSNPHVTSPPKTRRFAHAHTHIFIYAFLGSWVGGIYYLSLWNALYEP